MRAVLRFTIGAAVALAALTGVVPARAQEGDPAAREWTQLRGNSSRAGVSAVEGLGGQPVEAWRRKLPGVVVAEPVTWGGMVFVAAQSGKSRKLLAFRSTTGEPAGSVDLGTGGARIALASWQSVVIVGEGERIRTWRHDGTKLSPGWTKSGSYGGPPCVFRGYCLVAEGDALHCYDVVRGGNLVAKADLPMESAISALPDAASLKKEKRVGGPACAYAYGPNEVHVRTTLVVGTRVLLSRSTLCNLGTPKTTLTTTACEPIAELDAALGEDARWTLVPCHVAAGNSGACIVLGQSPFKGGSTACFVPDLEKARGVGIVTAAAVCGGTAFAFNGQGDLQTWLPSGRTETLLPAANAPQGSSPCAATASGGIVYLGNWAVAAAERRVAWRLPTAATTPVIPIGDKRLLFGSNDELVCVADPSVATAPPPEAAPVAGTDSGAAAAAGAPTRTPAAEPTRFKAPADVPGVLLADGRQFEGTYERSKDKLVIHPKEGADVEASVLDVVVAEKDGEVDIRGDDNAAFKIWRGAARATFCDGLEEVFREYAKASFVAEARAAMARMRAAGASEARLQKLDRELNGKSQKNDENRKKKLLLQEKAAADAMVQAMFDGSDWCAKRELLTAATGLLNEAERIDSSRAADVDARCVKLVPDSFPWKKATADSPQPGRQWRRWADQLLPASASFVAPDDDVFGRKLDNKPWDDGATLGFRTRNVLLFIRDWDPAICGKALSLSEGTVRALQVYMNEGRPDDVTAGDEGRLEIRIHKNKKDYLDEETLSGKAPEWSAGNFSPREGISRFYVDRRSGSADIDELTRVLTHEFTHHYMEMRWAKKQGYGGAGQFVIEGMAEFIQNQAHQMDRRGLAFDDETVPGIDATAQIAKLGRCWKASEFMDLKREAFDALSDENSGELKLRHSFKPYYWSPRQLWYDQAGALCFFFLVKQGPEVRGRFIDYVRTHYEGVSRTPGYDVLGYESPEALDKAFSEFLKSVAGG